MKSKKIGAIVTAFVTLGVLVGCISSIERIKAGYAGVVYNMNGGVSKETLNQGWHLVFPTKHITSYSIATEQAFLSRDKKEGSPDDDSFLITSKDGKGLNVDLEFSYHFDVEKLPETFTRFKGQSGKSIEQTVMKGRMKAFATEVSSKFSVLDIYGEKRSDLNRELFKYSKEKFKEFGVVIDSVNFTRIEVDDQTSKAIQTRINSQQELERQKIELETAKIQSDKAKVEAESKAQVVRIGAKAEAEANKLKQQSVNDTIVKYEMVKKWDGKQSQVQGGTPIIDLR